MKTRFWIFAGLILATPVQFASAQEEWGGRRWEYMRGLRMDCESGDEEACERLRHMRHEERRWREYEGDRDRSERAPRAPRVDPKVALCLTIENNYNNCVTQQQRARQGAQACAPWLVQLKANGCF